MSDDRLLADFLTHRDESAFAALVIRYGPMVLRTCRDILDEPVDAEDAFQATFLVLAHQAASIRDRASVGRWLYEVACRISRRSMGRLLRRRAQEWSSLTEDPAAPPDLEPADREMKVILHDEIRRLPSKLRDAIVLCYFEGLTVEDAARRLGCPVGTLKSRLGKGREVLRARLTRRGLAASALLLLMFSLTEEVQAEVPWRLMSSTVKAGISGVGTEIVSRRVAVMVSEEEARRPVPLFEDEARRPAPWPIAPWILTIALLVGLAAFARAASIRLIRPSPEMTPATSDMEAAPASPCQLP